MLVTPYRKEAIANESQRERLDDLLKVSAPHERVFLTGISVTVLVFLCWMAFGSVTRTLSFDGILLESGSRYPIVSKSDGRLETYLVDLGDHLEAGDPVARQVVPELEERARMLRGLANAVSPETDERTSETLASLQALITRSRLQLEAERIANGIIVSDRPGVVMALPSSPGEKLAGGDAIAWIHIDSDLPPRAVAQVTYDVARQIIPGMPATVTITSSFESPRQFSAWAGDTIVDTLPDWFAPGVLADYREPLVRVDFVLDSGDLSGLLDKTPAKIEVILEGRTPASLLMR